MFRVVPADGKQLGWRQSLDVAQLACLGETGLANVKGIRTNLRHKVCLHQMSKTQALQSSCSRRQTTEQLKEDDARKAIGSASGHGSMTLFDVPLTVVAS